MVVRADFHYHFFKIILIALFLLLTAALCTGGV